MLRLTNIKLPLDHAESALTDAILARLGIAADELTGYTVVKRSYDARKRGGIVLIYSLDVETPREGEILQRLLDDEATAADSARKTNAGNASDHRADANDAGTDKTDSTPAAGDNKLASRQPPLHKVSPTPDTTYKFIAHASAHLP